MIRFVSTLSCLFGSMLFGSVIFSSPMNPEVQVVAILGVLLVTFAGFLAGLEVK